MTLQDGLRSSGGELLRCFQGPSGSLVSTETNILNIWSEVRLLVLVANLWAYKTGKFLGFFFFFSSLKACLDTRVMALGTTQKSSKLESAQKSYGLVRASRLRLREGKNCSSLTLLLADLFPL